MNNSNTDSSQSKEYYVVCPILTVQGSGDGWVRQYAGPIIIAPHAGIAWRFKLLSLSSCLPPPPCTTPPSSLSTGQSGTGAGCLHPFSLPPSPQEHLVFKLRLHLISTLINITVLTENFLSGNSYHFPLWKACHKFMARNKTAFGDCCFNQYETNLGHTHSNLG